MTVKYLCKKQQEKKPQHPGAMHAILRRQKLHSKFQMKFTRNV